MANAFYEKGQQHFAQGDVVWKATGGNTIKIVFVDSADYTLDLVNHESLADIPSGARVKVSQALTLIDPAKGECDAEDLTVADVTGDQFEYAIFIKDSGVEATSWLLACFDQGGLPCTPNGQGIDIVFNNGANKIFRV